MLNSKIHRATITKKELHYSGSIGIDKVLLAASGIAVGEKVHVLNVNSGARFETYIIEEKKGSGNVVLYGPAARCGEVGDKIIVISYVLATPDEAANIKPIVVFVDEKNRISNSNEK